MNDIKVGEYCRTKDGIIGIFEGIDEHCRHAFEDFKDTIYCLKTQNEDEHIRLKYMPEHSQNIIDLIECGDYVNGRYVQKITKMLIYFRNCSHRRKDELYVKDIVTHEQFNSIKYVLGGKEE